MDTKVTRKIYHFTPEQLQNLTSVFWLYRGQQDRFLGLVESYLQGTLDAANDSRLPTLSFLQVFNDLVEVLDEINEDTDKAYHQLSEDIEAFVATVGEKKTTWEKASRDNTGLITATADLEPMAETSRDLIKQIDQLYKLANDMDVSYEVLLEEIQPTVQLKNPQIK